MSLKNIVPKYSLQVLNMVQLTIQQRVFIVKHYLETKSYAQVRFLFRNEFPERNPPTNMAIYKNVKKYLENENFDDS